MRLLVRWFSIIIILFAPFAAQAIDFEGIAAYPANPDPNDARTSSWFVYTLSPNETQNDALIVENNTNETKTFDLYPADSIPTTDNGFALKQQAEQMENVGKWVLLEANTATVKAHERISLPFKITVPESIKPGLFSGGIMISEHNTKNSDKGMNINVRVGVRMYVTVVTPISTIGDLTLPNRPYMRSLYAAGLVVGMGGLGFLYLFSIVRRKKLNKNR